MPTDIGEMQVGLSLDEASFTQSMNSLEGSINELSDKFGSLNADTIRTEDSLSGLAKTFLGLGLAGTGALVAIAKDSPAVAGAMADMEISSFRLSNAVGDSLAPAFEKGAESFGKLADFFEANSGTISDSIIGEIDKIENRFAVLDKVFEPIKKIIKGFKGDEEGEEGEKGPVGKVFDTLFPTHLSKIFPNPLNILDLFGTNPETGKLQLSIFDQQQNNEYQIMNSPNMIITGA